MSQRYSRKSLKEKCNSPILSNRIKKA